MKFAKNVVLIGLFIHKPKFELFGGGLCVPILHFDTLRCTVSEISAKIVGTGSIDHPKAAPKYFHQYFLGCPKKYEILKTTLHMPLKVTF